MYIHTYIHTYIRPNSQARTPTGKYSKKNNVFYNSNSLNYIKWKRGGLSKFKEVDLVFLNDIGKENLVEAHRKCILLVRVGSPQQQLL